MPRSIRASSTSRRFRRRWRLSALVVGAIVAACVLMALAAPLLAPHDPIQIFSGQLRKPPSLSFFMGTDEIGRDILSRVIFGGRVSLRVGLISVSIAMACGSALGLIAGYLGGWTDAIIMRVVDVMLAFPGILLAIAIVAVGFA